MQGALPLPQIEPESPGLAVTGADLALNDLTVVNLYHDLAARHDQLVDWVLFQCVPQTAQSTKKPQ
jgi:hypothetical protein